MATVNLTESKNNQKKETSKKQSGGLKMEVLKVS
jgi:hypothetical protein